MLDRASGPIDQLSAPLIALFLGVGFGVVLIFAAGLETKWLVYLAGALIAGTVLFAVPNRTRLLWVIFLMSFQADVYVRFMYGHAGSAGLAFPLSFLAALAVLVNCGVTRPDLLFGSFRWGGRQGWTIIAMLGTAFVSVVLGNERFVGLSQLLELLQYLTIFLVATNLIRDIRDYHFTLKLLLATLIAQALVYYVQSFLGITFTLTGQTLEAGALARPGGTVSVNPAGFTSFVIPLILVASAHAMDQESSRRLKWVCAIAACLGMGAVALSLTRAAWGALVLGLTWFVLVGWRLRFVSPRSVAAIALAAVLVFALAIPLMMARLEGAPIGESYSERRDLERMALAVIRAHPIAGVGLGAYDIEYKKHLPDRLRNSWQFTVHNQFLLVAAERGIPGALAFVGFIFVGLKGALNLFRDNAATHAFGLAWSAGIVALCFAMWWVPWIGFTYNALFWFLMGVSAALGKLPNGGTRSGREDLRNAPKYVSPAMAIRRDG